ncbi:hypothetical protein ABPG75_006094 [Micractinium tetrahymenae]
MLVDSGLVAEECWKAAIPVQLRLADSEVSSLEQPPVLYFLVPRYSYLHRLVPQALQLLQHLLPPGELVPWFEHGHLPLKWGVPAGVMYDLVAGPGGELPWQLTLHFRGFPDRQLPAYGGEAALRGAFFNSLKEATHICRGSAQRVMEMAAGAQEDLWRQVLAGSLQQYQRIVGPLQLAPAVVRGRGPAAVPLRLYIRRDSGGYLSSYEDIVCTSRPVAAQAPDGSSVTLRQALLPLIEECLAETLPEDPAGGPTAAAGAAAVDTAGGQAAEGGAEGGGLAGASADAESPRPAEAEASASSLDGGATGSRDAAELSGTGAASAATEAAEAGEPAAGELAAGAPAESLAAAAAAAAAAGTAAQAAAATALERAAAARGVLVCGTAPPLDTPLAWLHAQMHAGDHFLYVVLHLGRAAATT